MIEWGRWDVVVSEDERYVWEPDEVTLGEQRMIIDEFASSGGHRSYKAWIRAVGVDEDPDGVQVLVWFLRRKAGRQEDRFAVDIPRPRHMTITQIKEPEPADDADDAADAADGDEFDPEGSAG